MGRIPKLIVAALAALALALPASAAAKVVTIEGAPAPGPAKYDKVFVSKFGPAGADRVLVLAAGTVGGAGDFTLVAKHLVKTVPGLQVWAVDRRSEALEDTSVFERVLDGKATLDEAFDYYLGFQPDGYQFLNPDDFPFVRKWGVAVALNDLRRVVQAARKGGRQVILGGHSLGASLAVSYASWDFGGRPGYLDLDGLVLIDGGLLDSFDAFNLAEAKAAIAELEQESPFADLIGLGIPEATGIFASIGGLYAGLEPGASAQKLQDYPALPADLDPGYPVTNRGLLGFAFDRGTSPDSLSLIHVNGGKLAGGGSACAQPCDWTDGGVTPIARVAQTFGQEPNGVEWFYPRRLNIDANGADQLRNNKVARYLGLRLKHSDQVDLPVYAVQTDLTDGGVLRGARNFIERARTTPGESKLVDGDPQMSHLDPLIAAPKSNVFLKTVAPFLSRSFAARR